MSNVRNGEKRDNAYTNISDRKRIIKVKKFGTDNAEWLIIGENKHIWNVFEDSQRMTGIIKTAWNYMD